jgi:hypothetical protein
VIDSDGHLVEEAAYVTDPLVLVDHDHVEADEDRLLAGRTQIESASDVTLNGLHLETFVPADDRTRRVLSP